MTLVNHVDIAVIAVELARPLYEVFCFTGSFDRNSQKVVPNLIVFFVSENIEVFFITCAVLDGSNTFLTIHICLSLPVQVDIHAVISGSYQALLLILRENPEKGVRVKSIVQLVNHCLAHLWIRKVNGENLISTQENQVCLVLDRKVELNANISVKVKREVSLHLKLVVLVLLQDYNGEDVEPIQD